uniref:Uncharacterized protein n=1 Tax=Trichobilharzia regenti TaxID=157069 RepID=A0AA85K892_TRIRE|nr:unnamed protein product [Trichobilharzia regenti]CAH8840601.1 unnamed protein product [Trichobilharzia regenti]
MVSISPLNYTSVHKSLKAAKDNLPYDIDDVSSQLGMSTWTKEYKSGSPNRMKENLPIGIDGSSSSSLLLHQTASSLPPNPFDLEEKENLLKAVILAHSDNSQFRLINVKKPCQGPIDEEQLKPSSQHRVHITLHAVVVSLRKHPSNYHSTTSPTLGFFVVN